MTIEHGQFNRYLIYSIVWTVVRCIKIHFLRHGNRPKYVCHLITVRYSNTAARIHGDIVCQYTRSKNRSNKIHRLDRYNYNDYIKCIQK